MEHKYSTWVLIMCIALTTGVGVYAGIDGSGTAGYIPVYSAPDRLRSSEFISSSNNTMNIHGTFNVTGNSTFNNVNITGNLSVKRPYMMASDNTTQPILVINTAQAVNFSTIEDSWLITKVGSSNFTFSQSGDYLIELSAISSSTVAGKRVQIWVQKNGVNVPRSNTIYDFKSANANAVIAVPFIIDMNTGDTMRIMIAGDSTGITLNYYTNTSYSPETPSIILTISKISELT